MRMADAIAKLDQHIALSNCVYCAHYPAVRVKDLQGGGARVDVRCDFCGRVTASVTSLKPLPTTVNERAKELVELFFLLAAEWEKRNKR